MFIKMESVKCFFSYSSKTRLFNVRKRMYASNIDIGTKQKELMARGLPKKKPIPGVKNVLVVASGKGGVGKSTTAVNLATVLAATKPELKVGLLDADVFGPSIPLMMGLNESPLLNDDNLMLPLVNYGVKCMSMGFLVTDRSALMWRGLMVMQALDKLLYKVDWGHLDILVIDTPPGTGDTHLSLVQNLPIAGVMLVTTPQQAAVDVTLRGAVMFQKLKVPIVGIVQNMSSFICPDCKNQTAFYSDSTHRLTREIGVEIIENIPIDSDISSCCDAGRPIVVDKPHSPQARSYANLASIIIQFINKKETSAT